jgi:putative nucleotidyltransferase with HDIG domain
MSRRETPPNLLAHVQLVAAAAYTLAVWLRRKGETVNPVLTHRGGLLHDLAKMASVRRAGESAGLDHAAEAAELLNAYDQPELAEIANRHMPYQDHAYPRRPITWEQKLVHVADKLAESAKLVSLEERFQALKGRYPQYALQIEESRPLSPSCSSKSATGLKSAHSKCWNRCAAHSGRNKTREPVLPPLSGGKTGSQLLTTIYCSPGRLK